MNERFQKAIVEIADHLLEAPGEAVMATRAAEIVRV
jgi:hypothetical protein